MESCKKQRSANWNIEEKELLSQIVGDSAHIIENKSTKTDVNIEKNKEWKNITNKFNKMTGKTRSCGQVKLAWKRIKLTAKASRQQQSQTGAGKKAPSHDLRKNISQNTTHVMKETIVDSNIAFKKRHLEMLEVEHGYNVKISQLKIKKLELEIELLESKKKPLEN